MHRRRRRPGEDRVLRRRQDRGRDGGRARRRHPLLQRRVGGRARAAERGRRPRRPGRARSRSASTPTSIRRRIRTSRPGLKESKFGVAFDRCAGALPARRGAAAHRRCAASTATSARRSPTSPSTSRRPRRCSRWSTGSRPTASPLAHVDLGGGLGIRYRDEETIDAARLRARRAARARQRAASELLFEPGRFLVGDAGVLLTRVLYLKPGGDARLRDRRRGDERPDPPGALRRLARGRAGAPARTARRAAGRSSGRSARAPISSRTTASSRSRAGDLLAVRARRRLRVRDELELQLAAARLRGRRRRRSRASRPAARDDRGSLRARIAAAVMRACARDRSRAHRRIAFATPIRGVRNRNSRACKARNRREKSCNSKKCG